MARGLKQTNDYAQAIEEIYANTPKAVLAAIAVSLATTGGDFIEDATERILREWEMLYQAEIVLQKPVRPANTDWYA